MSRFVTTAVVALATAALALPAHAATYAENFDGGAPGFTLIGFWHVTTNFPAGGTAALGYVKNETPNSATPDGDYDTGPLANSGLAFTPLLHIAASGPVTLTLDAVNFNEIGTNDPNISPDAFDILRISVFTTTSTDLLASTSTGDNAPVYFAPVDATGSYTALSFDLSAYHDQFVQIGFSYDTVDESFNANPGARIDNIVLDGVSAVPEPAAWTLLIAGFGLVGTAVRRRTRTTVAA